MYDERGGGSRPARWAFRREYPIQVMAAMGMSRIRTRMNPVKKPKLAFSSVMILDCNSGTSVKSKSHVFVIQNLQNILTAPSRHLWQSSVFGGECYEMEEDMINDCVDLNVSSN